MIWIILLLILFLIVVVNFKNKKTPIKKNDTIRRKEIDVNLKDYPGHYSFNVAGVHLQQYSYAIYNYCKVFDLIELIPESDNRFDSNAIKVLNSGWHIGYVPAIETSEVNEILSKDYIAYIEYENKLGFIEITIKIRYKIT